MGLNKEAVGKVKCTKCKALKSRIFSGLRPNGSRIYKESSGLLWGGHTCNSCVRREHIEKTRSKGVHKHRKDSTDPRHVRSYQSELIAAKFFKSMGYSVEQASCQGPDLTLTMGGIKLTCEVKYAGKQKDRNSWRVAPVFPNRRSDNLIAIVLPDDSVIVQPMSYHLACCSNCGSRSVTSIVKLKLLEKL